jgi:flagellar hook-basal body complex protein FliE
MSDINISSIGATNSINGALQSSSANTDSSGNFADVLSQALSFVNETGNESGAASLDLLTGNTGDLSSTMIATEKAEIALNLTVAIRNKAIDAYKEVMNMQV